MRPFASTSATGPSPWTRPRSDGSSEKNCGRPGEAGCSAGELNTAAQVRGDRGKEKERLERRDCRGPAGQDVRPRISARRTSCPEDGVSIQVALAKVIRATGVKEFAATAGMAPPNVLRAINPRHN